MKRFKRPFTLVELLCVIVVIALLAAISIKVTQVAYRRADDTKTNTMLEIIRAANEQYKTKNGYYYPNSKCSAIVSDYNEKGYYSIPLDEDFLGEAYETCKTTAMSFGNKNYVTDAWGNAIRYSSPGIVNTGSYDMYSVGRDKGPGNIDGSDTKKKTPGFGDDIANFKGQTKKK